MRGAGNMLTRPGNNKGYRRPVVTDDGQDEDMPGYVSGL
jgi:hypothetical protein